MGPVSLRGERRKIDRYTFWVLCILTLASILFVTIHYREEIDDVRAVAREIANTAFEKDVAYRRWNAMHGGVYAPVTEKTPPNSWLDVPEREIRTPSGRLLTKVNPAYMTRQVYELMRENPDALIGHITSLRPIRPENAPFPWEVDALKSFERGEREFVRIDTVDGSRYLRFMKPFVTEKPCLACHKKHGYREGEIRGGISITVPLERLYVAASRHNSFFVAFVASLWLTGVGITIFFRRRLQRALDDAERGWDEALRRERTYRVLFDESQAVMLLVDPDSGRIVRANPAAIRFYGYSQEEFSSLSIFGINIAPRDEVRTLIDQVRGGELGRFVARHRRKGGEIRVVEVMSTPVEIEGRVILHSIVSDVSDREEAQSRAEENLRFAWALVSQATAPTFVIDSSHRVTVWNRGLQDLTGVRAEDMVGTSDHWRGFYDSPTPCLADMIVDRCLKGEECSLLTGEGDVVIGGRRRSLSFAAAPVYGDRGELLAVIETVFDMTDRYELRDQLVLTQKMETMGLLVSGVAHDFNNILTVISGYATLLSMTLTDSDHKHHAEEILAAVERASAMTRTLLAFSGRHGGERSRLDLVTVVTGMQKMLRRLLPESISLTVDSVVASLPVVADRTQMEQVVMNLVVNARDAVGGGGSIRVILTDETIGETDPPGTIPPGRYAVIMVEDDGTGIAPDIIDRIFDPFFTTKGSVGTGLGLSIVREIAAAHGGRVTVESRTGKGTRFRIFIPIAEHGEDTLRHVPSAPLDYHGTGTVLVVEDDQSIRDMVASALRRYGYEPIECSGAQEALAHFTLSPGSFSAIVSDLVMPGMSGAEFLRQVRSVSPRIPFIIISGYHDGILSGEECRSLDALLISKPFTPLQLLAILKERISSPPDPVS